MEKVILGTGDASRVPEFGGSTWVRLQYMLGLQRLGIQSFWVDRLGPVDSIDARRSLDYLIRRFHQTACDFGFSDRYCIIYNEGEKHFGMSERQLRSLVQETDLLLNINGWLPSGSSLNHVPRRAYIDVDPGFTQIWALEKDLNFAAHNFFFTVGQNVDQPEFRIPTNGVQWQPILPPVVLDEWPAAIDERWPRFTTIADWRGSQYGVYRGQHYRGKRVEFRRFIKIPGHTKQQLELALLIGHWDFADIGRLCRQGWQLVDPYQYTGNPHAYREYIQTSRAELSVAKHGYVRSNSGWISDRTACYLASGKPALVQSTGFENRLPTGKGLLTFRDLQEVIAGIQEINANYLEHCRAARQIAEDHFNSDVVLGGLLRRVGL